MVISTIPNFSYLFPKSDQIEYFKIKFVQSNNNVQHGQFNNTKM